MEHLSDHGIAAGRGGEWVRWFGMGVGVVDDAGRGAGGVCD